MRPRLAAFVSLSLVLATALWAQTPPVQPKRIPPAGLTLTTAERAELTAGVAALGREIDALGRELAGDAKLLALLPDVEVLHKAVDWALRYDEFQVPKEITFARHLLDLGNQRVANLRAKQAPWLEASGLILRGHRSRLDGSVQPYGLSVPDDLAKSEKPVQLMVWLLGRGEKRTELAFLAEREAGPAQLTPKNTITLVPYGRFCNATKFAGEVDVFEALAAVRTQYKIDPLRIAVAGFSMGGGSTWHLAAHHSGVWAVASPGAGFAETPIFTKANAPGKEFRPAWEQLLWRQYECTGVAANFFNVPTLAYAGELDGQKEASDLMEAALEKEGMKLNRFTGPQTGHKYHPETKAALTELFDSMLTHGREPVPAEVRLSTYTLRYPEAAWVRIEGMTKHWERSDIHATLDDKNVLTVETKNVTAFALRDVNPTSIVIDGQRMNTFMARGGTIQFTQKGDTWRPGAPAPVLRKKPGLTGPVDDAFMDSFLFVRPTGKPINADVGAWVESELTAARTLWRDVFRGEVPIKTDRTVTDADIANHNLILWGDPSSNAILARILERLPLHWNKTSVMISDKAFPIAHYVPILVFPNPLNPARYVVLNSGIDFRADGYGNNALQTPKLPDWAVVDLRTPPGPRWPGKIVDAGFFDEEWK